MGKWAFVAAAAVPVVLFGGTWLIDFGHEAEFFGYVHENAVHFRNKELKDVTQHDRAWLDEHRDIVLADGRAACEWLEQFPEAPEIVPSGDADSAEFRARYIQQTRESTQMAVSKRTRIAVLAGAWEYLCPGTRDSRTSPSFELEDD
jgi:hypothetical protein